MIYYWIIKVDKKLFNSKLEIYDNFIVLFEDENNFYCNIREYINSVLHILVTADDIEEHLSKIIEYSSKELELNDKNFYRKGYITENKYYLKSYLSGKIETNDESLLDLFEIILNEPNEKYAMKDIIKIYDYLNLENKFNIVNKIIKQSYKSTKGLPAYLQFT